MRVFILLLLFRSTLQLVISPKSVKLFDSRHKLTSYQKSWDTQNALVESHVIMQSSLESANTLAGSLLLLQHPPTYTLGTGTVASECGPYGTVSLDGRKLEFETIPVDRAGQATYHGPGQLVMYPILDLTHFNQDIHWYLRSLEQVVIDSLASLNLESGRVEGLTGVWSTGRPISAANNAAEVFKVAAMGIKIRRWVTMHGVSINVDPDMRYFDNIVPCGIRDKKVGSICQFRPQTTVDEVASLLLQHFQRIFNVQLLKGDEKELEQYDSKT